METRTASPTIRPKFIMGWPAWWHAHGMKMRLGDPHKHDLDNAVVIGNSVAKVCIQRLSSDEDLWDVEYDMMHADGFFTSGCVAFSTLELESAFGIRDHITDNAKFLISLHGGSSASDGKFIRYERWLNIPDPGTGQDGDGNLSIELTPEIKEAVQRLIATR